MLNPHVHKALPVTLFDAFNNWTPHDGSGMPAHLRDEQLVKVMYSDGAISAYVRCAYAWRTWTGGRDWWKKPDPCDRKYIVAYVVI